MTAPSPAGPVTVNLPANPLTGTSITVKDGNGNAAVNNITIVPNGANTIEGNPSYTVNSNYGHVNLVWDGTKWLIV